MHKPPVWFPHGKQGPDQIFSSDFASAYTCVIFRRWRRARMPGRRPPAATTRIATAAYPENWQSGWYACGPSSAAAFERIFRLSLNGIASAAPSAPQTNSTVLRVVSNNVANLNTQGYARCVVNK